MFKRNQSGFTFLELLAYMALYGTVSAAIIAGISAMIDDSNVKHDLGEIPLIEKEIRARTSILNNFSVDKTKSLILKNDTRYASVTKLQEFLCINNSSFCQNKGNKDSILQTSHGTNFTVLEPGTVSYTVNRVAKITGYSFAIKFVNLSYNYCIGFADAPWNNDVIGIGIGNSSGTTFYPYGIGSDDEPSGKNPSTQKCPKGNTASFIIYYR